VQEVKEGIKILQISVRRELLFVVETASISLCNQAGLELAQQI
jgi:hypothetical protein